MACGPAQARLRSNGTRGLALSHRRMVQVNESLGELDRCQLFLENAEPVQVQYVFRSFADLVSRHGRQVFVKLPALQQALSQADGDSSILLAGAITEVCETHLLQVHRSG